MPRILITGAAGFLGSHLCDRYIREGYDVIGIDNLITGDLNNISHLIELTNFSFINHDVTEHIEIDGKLDYILHFASPASPIDYLKIPIQTLKVGSLGTHNCLGLARNKRARILIASTSEVYGDLKSIRRQKITGGMLIQSVQEVYMMKQKGFKRPLPWLIILIMV